jgi:DNA polymerase-4
LAISSGGTVLHLDIDAFFASVEQLRNPRLAGRPVAVGTGVIASCSYEARKFGLHAGMSLRQAVRLCPSLKILAGHAPIYRCFSERIFDLCQLYSPAVESYLDEAFCDLSGTERLHGNLLAAAAELKERVLAEVGLRVTVGLGRNRMFAKMAARSVKPDGLRWIGAEEEEEFIRELPIRDLPGIGPRAAQIFEKLNIHTIGAMRLLSRQSLTAMFGTIGASLYERCRGNDTRPIAPREIPRSIRRETSFPEDATGRETIEETLCYLAERAANTLRQLHLKAKQVEVKIRYGDFETLSSSRKFPSPTQIDAEIFQEAVRIRRALHTRRVGLRLVGVALEGLVADDGLHQLTCIVSPPSRAQEGGGGSGTERSRLVLSDIDSRRRELGLLHSLDAIRRRYGYASVVCGRSLDLLGRLEQDEHGFILRTPSLTR